MMRVHFSRGRPWSILGAADRESDTTASGLSIPTKIGVNQPRQTMTPRAGSRERAGNGTIRDIADCHFVILGDVTGELLKTLAAEKGSPLDVRVDLDVQRGLEKLAAGNTAKCVVLIDIDTMDVVDAVDILLDFRRAVKGLPLLIASRGFLRDDLSEDRCAIADASVRLPTRTKHIHNAILAAMANNTFRMKLF